jgi:hypothetical protein
MTPVLGGFSLRWSGVGQANRWPAKHGLMPIGHTQSTAHVLLQILAAVVAGFLVFCISAVFLWLLGRALGPVAVHLTGDPNVPKPLTATLAVLGAGTILVYTLRYWPSPTAPQRSGKALKWHWSVWVLLICQSLITLAPLGAAFYLACDDLRPCTRLPLAAFWTLWPFAVLMDLLRREIRELRKMTESSGETAPNAAP